MQRWEQDLVDQAVTLGRGEFTDRAADVDREGILSAKNLAELVALDLPGAALPEAFGGRGLSLEGSARVMEALAYGCGSTAVAFNMHVLVADSLVYDPPFPRSAAVLEDIARNGALICQPGSVPLAELDSRPGGFRFTVDGDDLIGNGKAGFGTMSDAASYAKVVGVLETNEGEDPHVVVALPATTSPGLRIHGNWNGMGLRGTASHDISLTDVRIPRAEALVTPVSEFRASVERGHDEQVAPYRNRFRGLLGSRAIWLGLAQAATDFATAYCSRRYGAMQVPVDFARAFGASGDGLRADSAWAQIEIGRMQHWTETSRIVLYDLIRRLDSGALDAAAVGSDLTRTTYQMRRMSEEVAHTAMRVCGAHAYVRNQPLERIFRDMIGCNVMGQKTEELAQTMGVGALGRQKKA